MGVGLGGGGVRWGWGDLNRLLESSLGEVYFGI